MLESILLAGPIRSRLDAFRRKLADEIEAAGGRHDEAAIYAGEPGDPGIGGGPGSISWEINGDLASLVVAGTGAILMEVLHPSVMAGVFTQSSYRTDPLRRARNTLGYVLRTTFGSTKGATRVIESVKNIHARINGTRPDGVPYRALDPELIGWVHTCIPWAVMTAYDRYGRALSLEEKDRYLKEQAVIGRMGGADQVPESVAELADYVERMRPLMSMNEQTRNFLAFVAGASDDFPVGRRERFDRWVAIRGSMSLMPEWAQQLTGTHQPEMLLRIWLQPTDRLKAAMVRWAYPELPCKQMAIARATGTAVRPLRSDGECAA
jgi:uncharacterized protein (DUF2236 family)